jgi:hypothetical protein
VRVEFRKVRPARSVFPAEDQLTEEPETKTAAPTRSEFGLMQLLFQHEDLAQWVAAHLEPDWVGHPLVRKIILERIRASREGTWQGLPHFLDCLADSACQSVLTEAVSRNYMEGASGLEPVRGLRDHLRGRGVPKPFEDLVGFVTSLRNDHLDSEVARLNRELATLEPATAEQIETFKRVASLKALKKQPIAPGKPK